MTITTFIQGLSFRTGHSKWNTRRSPFALRPPGPAKSSADRVQKLQRHGSTRDRRGKCHSSEWTQAVYARHHHDDGETGVLHTTESAARLQPSGNAGRLRRDASPVFLAPSAANAKGAERRDLPRRPSDTARSAGYTARTPRPRPAASRCRPAGDCRRTRQKRAHDSDHNAQHPRKVRCTQRCRTSVRHSHRTLHRPEEVGSQSVLLQSRVRASRAPTRVRPVAEACSTNCAAPSRRNIGIARPRAIVVQRGAAGPQTERRYSAVL